MHRGNIYDHLQMTKAFAYKRQGKPVKAFEIFLQIQSQDLEDGVTNTYVLREMAEICEEAGDEKNALGAYEQILDEKKDLQPLLQAREKFEFIMRTYPDTDYATDARFKIDLIIDQLAAKEMSIARYYMKTEKWIPALNRLKIVVDQYDKTIFVEEALHRLVEVYYRLGLLEEAKRAASILGYNYRSGDWYKRSYKVFNKKYKS